MKNKLLLIISSVLLLSSCTDLKVLDREPLNSFTDESFWRTEDNLRLYANNFYLDKDSYALFYGYSRGWNANYVPVRTNYVSDDFAISGPQSGFTTTNTGSTSYFIGGVWPGRGWNYTVVRRVNLFLNRIDNKAKSYISADAYNHWSGIARFFRAIEYAELVRTYGDVPWFSDEVKDTDFDTVYKQRDSRETVMNNVYDDLKYALENVRLSDGDNKTICNRYTVAAFASRIMLWEGTWQYYHNNNSELAKKYLTFAAEAAKFVMDSGKYSIDAPFHQLFGSESLANNKEAILYRHYDAAQSITHCIASYSNGDESQTGSANLSLLKSFICNDGKVWENSGSFAEAGISLANEGEKFTLANLIKTRDPRFESTFYHEYRSTGTLIYCNKFIDRLGTENGHQNNDAKYTSSTNTNDAPMMRLGEVLLNYIEAKAELAVHLGGSALTQDDIDKTINALRDRPLDDVAKARGVKKTAHLQLASLPNDPERDTDVPEIIWEVRRERRMELIYEEPTRLYDLKRWKKLDYMTSDASFNDIMLGPWIDWNKTTETDPCDTRGILASCIKDVNGYKNLIGVKKLDGTIVKYDGTNAADMVGFNLVYNGTPRTQEPEDRHYLAPVPLAQIDFYKSKGYELSQNPGWDN